jgi:hypothetical protein
VGKIIRDQIASLALMLSEYYYCCIALSRSLARCLLLLLLLAVMCCVKVTMGIKRRRGSSFDVSFSLSLILPSRIHTCSYSI